MMSKDQDLKTNSSSLPPPAPERRDSSGGSRGNTTPPAVITKSGSNRKSRAMRINIASNSVQFDTSTILEEFLYLGAKGVTADLEKLNGLGVAYIINCSQEDAPMEYPSSIQYLQVDVEDAATANIEQYFNISCDFIERARKEKKACLVHCTMGMSRSCSIVLAYLVRNCGMSLHQALIHVKERRPVVSPNPGFMSQLVNFEKSVRGKISIDPEKYAKSRFAEPEQFLAN